MSCGFKASISAAQSGGIECDRAVIVNDRMETSRANIWACGDCAAHGGMNYALWSQAVEQGMTAGQNAAGGDHVCARFDRSLILTSHDFGLFSAGDLGGDSQKSYEIIETESLVDGYTVNSRPTHAVERRYCADGKTVGGCIVGSLSGMEALRKSIEEA